MYMDCPNVSTAARVAIVVPVFNRAEVVSRTLDSIARQTLRPLHVVLVDNASVDDTGRVLRRWAEEMSAPDFRVDVLDCPRPGAAAARNVGLAAVTEPWVMFFDSDDSMPPGHAAAVAALPDDVDIAGWNVREVGPTLAGSDGATDGRILTFVGRNPQADNLFHGGMATQRWAARTELVRRVGAWNEDIRYWDDIELGARMLAQTARIRHLGDSEVKVYVSGDSITSGAAGSPSKTLPALDAIAKTLAPIVGGSRARQWCRVKLAIECGLADRGGLRDGLTLLQSQTSSLKALAAYYYTRAGHRGASRILRALGLI